MHRPTLLLTALAAMALSLPAAAAAPDTRTICLASDGSTEPTVCRGHTTNVEEICTCPTIATPVDAPICKAGEKPQAETSAFRRARADALKDGHSLVGKLFDGRPMCVEAPDRLGRH
jgi:hypothetical protein